MFKSGVGRYDRPSAVGGLPGNGQASGAGAKRTRLLRFLSETYARSRRSYSSQCVKDLDLADDIDKRIFSAQ